MFMAAQVQRHGVALVDHSRIRELARDFRLRRAQNDACLPLPLRLRLPGERVCRFAGHLYVADLHRLYGDPQDWFLVENMRCSSRAPSSPAPHHLRQLVPSDGFHAERFARSSPPLR